MGSYDRWEQYFRGLEAGTVDLTFDELARLAGRPLPPSAFKHAAWWSSGQPHAVWARLGWRASPDLRRQVVTFRRGQAPAMRTDPVSRAETPPGRRLVLLGCVAEKGRIPAPAKDLYVSALWRKRRGYAEGTGMPWAILSAEHGLVDPEQVIAPYDRALKQEPRGYRERWSSNTAVQVVERLRALGLEAVEAHAGADYLEHGLIAALQHHGIQVSWPVRGLKIGEQLAWYDTHGDRSPPAALPTRPLPAQTTTPAIQAPRPRLVSARLLGRFSFRWPDAVEDFDFGWEGEVEVDGRPLSYRHGVGHRVVYGMNRTHTVTWLGGAPTVEGVAADDYEESRALLSRIKVNARMVTFAAEVPAGYRPLAVVEHRAEIDAPYSPFGLAVKIRVDDLAGWLLHAALKTVGSSVQDDAPLTEETAEDQEPGLPAREPLPDDHKRGVAAALASFAPRAAEMAGDLAGVSFAATPEANRLLLEDPFALLLAVISDYQIPAERAWALPYLLEQRLGHLDPRRMLANPEAVREAVARRPSLHRYVNNVPSFFLEACRVVLEEYGGDAGRIWANEPTAVELQRRLQRFSGISQKKAAMAVEILERDFGIPIREMHGSDIAFDVHIRRVFLRSGLAEVDDQDHMVEAARTWWPERPGLLDLPSWVIGRRWCRPSNPECEACAIGQDCARRIDAAALVREA